MPRGSVWTAALVSLLVLTSAGFGSEPTGSDAHAKRKELWVALMKAKPKEIERIDAYAENASLTRVCFSANRSAYLFRLQDGKVERLSFQKPLPPDINRIVFGVDRNGLGWFELWSYGEVQIVFMTER
jgi:hypothetical protein